jgi:DNA-binding FadR family transcriptional regulator
MKPARQSTPTKTKNNGAVADPQIDRSTSVRTARVPELMAADIRKRIVQGDLKQGDTLPPETLLMEQYGVSRPTLREALRILEAESLIVVRRGGIGGAVVQRPSVDATARHFALILQDRGATIADVFKARFVIEPPAFEDLARSVTADDIVEIEERLDQLDSTVGSARNYAHAFSNFREYLIVKSGNLTLSLISRLLDDILEKHATRTGEAQGSDWEALQRKSQRSLRKLVSLLKEKDAQGASAFWQRHLEQAAVHLLKNGGSPTTTVDLIG